MKSKWFIVGILVIYFVLLFVDLGLNFIAVIIPSLGSAIESLSEIIIETLSAVGVVLLASIGLKK